MATIQSNYNHTGVFAVEFIQCLDKDDRRRSAFFKRQLNFCSPIDGKKDSRFPWAVQS